MSEHKKTSKDQGKKLEELLINLARVGKFVLKVSWHGLRRKIWGDFDHCTGLVIFYAGLFTLIYWHWMHLVILHFCLPWIFTQSVVGFLIFHVRPIWQFGVFASFGTVALGVALGFVHFFRMARYQKELKHIGLRSATGSEPQVIDVENTGEFKTKITIASQGVGLEHYKSKKSDLESSFGAIVENIRVSERSRKLVEIFLVDKELPTFVGYNECVAALTEPYSFVIGESLNGVIAQNIRSLPHLLIAGTSGNGKSVFFNQAMISMMRSSPHIQLYLLDLKLGVEVKAYSNLPNTRIAKDANEAVQLLQAIVKEMKKRFMILEEGGRKQIDPQVHKKDLILVGIDEASVLYGKRRGDKSGNDLTAQARELTDEIAKLGRAASIHLIIATQKVTNESIDTKIQENVGGRVCFRVNTLQGSSTVLGNKKAFELPDIKGRAIWASGNDFTEVQTPFVSEKLIAEEITQIKSDFDSGKRKCLQGMVSDQKTEVTTVKAIQVGAFDKAA